MLTFCYYFTADLLLQEEQTKKLSYVGWISVEINRNCMTATEITVDSDDTLCCGYIHPTTSLNRGSEFPFRVVIFK